MTISMTPEYKRAVFFKKLLYYSSNRTEVQHILNYLGKQYNNENRYFYNLTHVTYQLKLLELNHYLITDEEVTFLRFGLDIFQMIRGEQTMKRDRRK